MVRFSILVRADGAYGGRNPGGNATLTHWLISQALSNPFAALIQIPFAHVPIGYQHNWRLFSCENEYRYADNQYIFHD